MRHLPTKLCKGFTLVELMVVVAIIAILAAIAIPSYMKYVRSARTSEATANLAAIQTFEESYFSENDQYVTGGANPATFPEGGIRQPFNATLDAGWTALGRVIPNSRQVYFQYQVTGGYYDSVPAAFNWNAAGASAAGGTVTHGPAGECTTSIGNSANFNAVAVTALGVTAAANTHWFIATAIADQNSDNRCALFIAVTDRPDLTEEERIQ